MQTEINVQTTTQRFLAGTVQAGVKVWAEHTDGTNAIPPQVLSVDATSESLHLKTDGLPDGDYVAKAVAVASADPTDSNSQLGPVISTSFTIASVPVTIPQSISVVTLA